MPIYEYRCAKCGKVHEVLQRKTSDKPLKTCPACGGPVEKLISRTSFQLKGSGWYASGYSSSSKGSTSKSETGDSSASESSSSSESAEAKPSKDKDKDKSKVNKDKDTKKDTKGKESS